MEAFLSHISAFPTVFYTVALGVVIGYWLIVMLGLFDLEFLDVDVDMDFDADVSQIGGVAGVLFSFGLTGVPVTIVFSFLMLDSWLICYLLSRFIPFLGDWLSWIQTLVNISIIIVSFLISIPITAQMIKPLKRFFRKLNQAPIAISIIGKSCKVRSSRVDKDFGEAECLHQGASLIIKVRSVGKETFSTRDTVFIIEHNKENDTFVVVSENKFMEQMK